MHGTHARNKCTLADSLVCTRVDIRMTVVPLVFLLTHVSSQNPHNVHEWHKRVKIFQEQDAPDKVIKAYAEAVQTVDPIKADGKPHRCICLECCMSKMMDLDCNDCLRLVSTLVV